MYPVTSDQQPATSNQQPLTSNEQPASSIKQPASSIKLLFWFYALFIFYVTAIPFRLDLTSSGMLHRWRHAELIPLLNSEGRRLSLGDAVGNVLLFVPFGFFLYSWKQTRRQLVTTGQSREQISIPLSWLAALLFSGTIECCQLFLDGRTTSVNDVINNALGALIGIRLARAHPGFIVAAWEALKRMIWARPFWALWLATMAVQTVLALAPFDFTLKMESFQRQWLRWQYSWQALRSIEQVSANGDGWLQRFPHREYLLATLIAAAGCAILLGALAVVCCHRYGPRSPRICRATIAATLFFYPTLTILQFTVQSLRPYVLFLATGVGGVLTGILLTGAFLQLAARLSAWRES